MSLELGIAFGDSSGYVVDSPYLGQLEDRIVLGSLHIEASMLHDLHVDPAYALDGCELSEIIQRSHSVEIGLAILSDHENTIANETSVDGYTDWEEIFFRILRHARPVQVDAVSAL